MKETMLQNDDNKAVGLFYFKAIILLFWVGWFFLVSVSNSLDFIYHTGFFHYHILFQGDNYERLQHVLHVYDTPIFIVNTLFILDFIIQVICSILFALALYCFWQRNRYKWFFINLAFLISISLWAVFVIMQEVFLAYKVTPGIEHIFMHLALYEMVTLMMFHLLPD